MVWVRVLLPRVGGIGDGTGVKNFSEILNALTWKYVLGILINIFTVICGCIKLDLA